MVVYTEEEILELWLCFVQPLSMVVHIVLLRQVIYVEACLKLLHSQQRCLP